MIHILATLSIVAQLSKSICVSVNCQHQLQGPGKCRKTEVAVDSSEWSQFSREKDETKA